MIYHLVSQADFEQQPADQPYSPASLASEGFIHLTAEPRRVVWIANAFYRSAPDLIALQIDESRLTAPLRSEQTPDGLFPHLYGPLNRNAIVGIRPMVRDESGDYRMA